MTSLLIDDIRIDKTFARRLPSADDKQLEALARDITERGIIVELLVTKGGLLLDGHRRLAAARKAGLRRVPVKRLDVDGRTWMDSLAIAVNLYRRHLNEAHRASLMKKLDVRKATELVRYAIRCGLIEA